MHPVQQGRGGSARAHRGELFVQGVKRLLHFDLGFREEAFDQGLVCHDYLPYTSVPISSPSTTFSMLPSCIRSNTMIGRLLSMHMVMAVLSITVNPRLSTSR